MALTTLKFRIFLGVSLGFIYLAVIFVIVGLTTNYWLEIRDDTRHYRGDVEMHFGLHRVCWSSMDRCNNPRGNYDKRSFLPKVQGMVITGAILGMFSAILALVNFYFEMLEMALKKTSLATIIISVLAGLILIIGCIMFAEKVEINQGYGTMFDREAWMGYSFGLTTCAGGMMWVGAILTGLANFLGKSDNENVIPPLISTAPSESYYGPRSAAPSFIS